MESYCKLLPTIRLINKVDFWIWLYANVFHCNLRHVYLNPLWEDDLILVSEVFEVTELLLFGWIHVPLDVFQRCFCTFLCLASVYSLRSQQIHSTLTPLVHLPTHKHRGTSMHFSLTPFQIRNKTVQVISFADIISIKLIKETCYDCFCKLKQLKIKNKNLIKPEKHEENLKMLP